MLAGWPDLKLETTLISPTHQVRIAALWWFIGKTMECWLNVRVQHI
jgi:hypothetical protein